MSAKTTFWFGLVVAVAVVGLAVGLPLSTNDEQAASNGGTVVLSEQPKEPAAAAQPADRADGPAAVAADPSSVPQTAIAETEEAAPAAPAGDKQAEDAAAVSTEQPAAAGSDGSEPTADAAGTESQKPNAVGAQSPVPVHAHDQRPKPGYGQFVQVSQGAPFYVEFFQPFQPIPALGMANPDRQNRWPATGHQPLGAVVDPFDPFVSPSSPFNRIIEMYTNEFRKMLESFDQNIQHMPQQVENFDSAQSGSNKPVSKTTSKTEVINGHVVQINETTYSNGDDNHKSFYHFKEIQVLPEANKKNIANEKVMSMIKNDSEKIELNEIKRDPIETFDDATEAVIQPNPEKKVEQ